MATDLLAEVDRAAADLSPELQVVWLRFRGCALGYAWLDASGGCVPTIRLFKFFESSKMMADLYWFAPGAGGHCTATVDGTADEVARGITEWFRDRMRDEARP